MPSVLEGAKNFERISYEAAAEFLQTVVVVDDQALIHDQGDSYFIDRQATEEEIAKGGLNSEEEKNLGKQESANLSGATTDAPQTTIKRIGRNSVVVIPRETPTESKPPPPVRFHVLNARTLVNAFAQNGLVCSVLKPFEDSHASVLGSTALVARRADIVIVDWVMLDKHGDHALKVIQDIITDDRASRSRLIVVYTGENDFPAIITDIKNYMVDKLGLHFEDMGSNTLHKDSIRILALGKIHSTAAKGQAEKVDEAALPSRVIEEFSKMTTGLLSNVTLRALSFIRANTHGIITKLNAKLDPSYLSHRALLNDPDDSQEHLVALIADELRGLLEELDLADEVGITAIEAWLRSKYPSGTVQIQVGKTTKSASIDQIKNLLEVGIEKWTFPDASSSSKKQMFKTLTSTFETSKALAEESDHEFAMITALESKYDPSAIAPVLTLGSIICSETKKGKPAQNASTEKAYWLCIQPLCDCVRLQESRQFPLLPLKVVEATQDDPHPAFDVVIKEKDGSHLHLRIKYNPYECRMVEFSPTNQSISSVKDADGNFVFKTRYSGSKPNTYRWIANLKIRQAQRVLNNYASSAQRVGLNESEWLRRSSGKQ